LGSTIIGDFMHPAYTEPWPVGLRVDPGSDRPSFFVVQYGEDLLPLCSNGRVLSCVSLDGIGAILRASDQQVLSERTQSVEVVYDFASVVDVIRCGNTDTNADIADCLNFLFDCIKVTGGEIPPIYREVLVGLADCATFSKTVSDYLDSEPWVRARAHDAVMWCLGWFLFKITIVGVDETEKGR
jgi:hypothetical protein